MSASAATPASTATLSDAVMLEVTDYLEQFRYVNNEARHYILDGCEWASEGLRRVRDYVETMEHVMDVVTLLNMHLISPTIALCNIDIAVMTLLFLYKEKQLKPEECFSLEALIVVLSHCGLKGVPAELFVYLSQVGDKAGKYCNQLRVILVQAMSRAETALASEILNLLGDHYSSIDKPTKRALIIVQSLIALYVNGYKEVSASLFLLQDGDVEEALAEGLMTKDHVYGTLSSVCLGLDIYKRLWNSPLRKVLLAIPESGEQFCNTMVIVCLADMEALALGLWSNMKDKQNKSAVLEDMHKAYRGGDREYELNDAQRIVLAKWIKTFTKKW
jgi:hypothetical protein